MTNTAVDTAASGQGHSESGRLSGNMGTFKLVLTVLAFSSPLVTMAGYFSLTIGVTGSTAPLAFLVVTGALLVFSVGYMAIVRRQRKTGAYYAYITTGLGRAVGLASAYIATLSYLAICIGVYCFGGMIIQGLVTQFGGPEIPWWIGGLVCLAIIAALGYLNVDVSAKVLMWVMIMEVVLILIFDAAVFLQGGQEGLSVESFNVFEFTGAEAWVGFLFAILVFIGFEATALYRDEVKDPDKTIPRATYISVLFIGLLYTFSVWMLVISFGPDAREIAVANPDAMFHLGAAEFVGIWFSDAIGLLTITATIAALLSIHNAATRYIFNLGTDGGLPATFGKVHPKFRSPYQASAVASIASVATILIFVFAGSEPGATYGRLAGVGSTGIIALMILLSFAVVVWFRRNPKGESENAWKTFIAPLASTLFFLALLIYALTNFDLVVGGAPGELDWLLFFLLVPLIAGLVVARILKKRSPLQYDRIGGFEREKSHSE